LSKCLRFLLLKGAVHIVNGGGRLKRSLPGGGKRKENVWWNAAFGGAKNSSLYFEKVELTKLGVNGKGK